MSSGDPRDCGYKEVGSRFYCQTWPTYPVDYGTITITSGSNLYYVPCECGGICNLCNGTGYKHMNQEEYNKYCEAKKPKTEWKFCPHCGEEL